MAQKRGTSRRSRRRASTGKLFGSLAAVSLVAVVGVVGTRAAISATTDSTSNEFNAGEIQLADNDAGHFLYSVNNALPGDSVSKCIEVTYTSPTSLDSTVALYMSTPIDALGPYVDMTVDVGTEASPTFPDCTGFSLGSNIYTGTLADFQTTYPDATSGLTYSPHGTNPWTDGDSVVYRVTLTLQHTTRQPGEDFSGVHDYTWTATSV